jgi:hypothetical protein
MFDQAQMRTIAVFLSGMVMGVAAVVFLGGGREQPAALAGQADPKVARQAQQKDVSQIGRYQAFKIADPNWYAGLLDTTTGKVWSLQAYSIAPKYRWVALADGPK